MASLNKRRWVAIMKVAGFDEKAMYQWHQTFGEIELETHVAFLTSLQINAREIKRIRQLN